MEKFKVTFEISSELRENYKFRIKFFLPGGVNKIVVGELLETYVEDFIDPNKNIEYLDKLLQKIADVHSDVLMQKETGRLSKEWEYRFKDAKRELENEKK